MNFGESEVKLNPASNPLPPQLLNQPILPEALI